VQRMIPRRITMTTPEVVYITVAIMLMCMMVCIFYYDILFQGD
jgi:hypothetical protein